MGRAHYELMLRAAQIKWVRAMPMMSGLVFTESPLGPYSRDHMHVANLALGLLDVDDTFIDNMNGLLADGKIWVYEILRDGSRQRSRRANAFTPILDPTAEEMDAAISMGIL